MYCGSVIWTFWFAGCCRKMGWCEYPCILYYCSNHVCYIYEFLCCDIFFPCFLFFPFLFFLSLFMVFCVLVMGCWTEHCVYCDLLLFLLFKHHFVLCRSASKKCNILLYVDNLSSQVMILLSAVILNIKRMKQEKTKITSVLFFFNLRFCCLVISFQLFLY